MGKTNRVLVVIILSVLYFSVGTGQNDFSQTNITKFKHPKGIMLPMDRPPVNKRQARIMGGSEAKPHAYPYQVALTLTWGKEEWLCGGTLLGNQWILTAAHCVLQAKKAKVVLGAHNLRKLESLSKVMEATKFIIHKYYDREDLYNDIALIKLPTSVVFNDFIQPVVIADASKTYKGSEAVCLGWGKAESGKKQHRLREVKLKIISNRKCERTEEYEDILTEYHMCTSGDGESGSCAGGSGGPLLVDGKQVGVVSFGTKRCDAGYPSVYTRLSEYTGWLTKKTGVPVGERSLSGTECTMGSLVVIYIGAMFSVVNFFLSFRQIHP